MAVDNLQIQMKCSVKAQNAGLFISRGNAAMHPTRTIESHELIFVIEGELDMWEGSQKFHLCAGQTLHLWPGREHGSTKPMPPDLKFYWIHFEIVDFPDRNHNDSETLASVMNLPQTVQLSHPESLERLFRIYLNGQETGTLHPVSANLLTTLLLVEVVHQSQYRADSNDLNIVATWAHTFIRMNFDRPITASNVAKALGYNVDYLGRVYRQTYDCTLTEAIHRRRIRKACEYLLNSNLTVSQVAPKCGFSNPDYFRRIFKRFMRITPNDYRNENSRLHVITH